MKTDEITKKVKKDSVDTMWALMRMRAQKSNVPILSECCARLKRKKKKKTAGQLEYAKAGDERYETSLDQLMNFIIIETMCLWLSGGLNKLKDMEDEQ